jgi:hypothetical protein
MSAKKAQQAILRKDWSKLDTRRKPIVDSKAMDETYNTTVQVIDYQPGNGTRYLLQFIGVPAGKVSAQLGFGTDAKGWLVTHLNGVPPHTMAIPEYKGVLFPWDVVEKMDMNPADAHVIAEFIAWNLGMEFSTG